MSNPVLNDQRDFQLQDFAAATAADYRSAIEAGMAAQRGGLAALRDDQSPATVANVLGAWEDAETLLSRALSAFWAVHSANTTPELDAISDEFSPLLAEHDDAIFLDRALFARFEELERRVDAGEVEADAQDRYALDETLRSFRRAGVTLDDAQQARLRELNKELAGLSTRFETLNLGARNAGGFAVTEDELAGLSDEQRATLRTADGGYRIDLLNTTQQFLAAKLTNADVRARLLAASMARGLSGEFDTRTVVLATARARAERATLLGYRDHASLVAEAGCAKTTEAIFAMELPLAQAALAKARQEAEVLKARYAELNPGAEFSAADWSYVEAIVRKERYAFDEAELSEYLQVDKVLESVYAAAGELYGLTFVARPDLVGHTPDAQVFEVHDEDGVIGAFVMDFWARPTKKGGAWMNNLVDQSNRDRTLPVVTNNCNYTPSTSTITWDGVITMFHEFGHALHGLLANSRYRSRSGTSTPRDFVEFPSQVNEHWAWTPGRVLPAEWIERLKEADKFGQGYATAEVEISALLDQVWHTTPLDELPTDPADVEAFEAAALERLGLVEPLVPPRYRSSYFAHIWGGGYAASYYGYAWAKVMDADAVAWFEEQTGDVRAAGEHFRQTLLAPGGSVNPMETYRRFRGRDPQLQALLDRLGLKI